jgi:hypothetical protein
MDNKEHKMTAIILDTPEQIHYAQLAAVKGRLKLEALGIQFRGPKIRKHWAVKLGLKPTAPYLAVIRAIDAEMQQQLQSARGA